MSILQEADAGRPVNEIWRTYGIRSATDYKWKAQYGGLEASDVKRLKELEHENGRLKRMYADVSLENAALKEVIAKQLYGTATVVHQDDAAWREFVSLFPPLPGARQIFDVTLDLVQTSCGMAVPYLSYTGDRELLNEWAAKKGEEGLRQYREEKNQFSLDDIPTNIVRKSGRQ